MDNVLSLAPPPSSALAEAVLFGLGEADFSSPPAAPVSSGTMDWLVDRGRRLDSRYSTSSAEAPARFSLGPKDHRRGMVLKGPCLVRAGAAAFMLVLLPQAPRPQDLASGPPFS